MFPSPPSFLYFNDLFSSGRPRVFLIFHSFIIPWTPTCFIPFIYLSQAPRCCILFIYLFADAICEHLKFDMLSIYFSTPIIGPLGALFHHTLYEDGILSIPGWGIVYIFPYVCIYIRLDPELISFNHSWFKLPDMIFLFICWWHLWVCFYIPYSFIFPRAPQMQVFDFLFIWWSLRPVCLSFPLFIFPRVR